MIEQIDKRILALESELAELRHRKIGMLQAQIAEVQASLSGGGATGSSKAAKASAGKPGKGWAAEIQGKAAWTPDVKVPKSTGLKRRGRRPGKRVPDDHILPTISKIVAASGKEGISARKVSQATGIFYQRVVKMMDEHFKKTGERKWSRYHLK